MLWIRLAAITIGAGVVSSLTDWFFAGDWIHRRYTYPEVWRKGAESRRSPSPAHFHFSPVAHLRFLQPGSVFNPWRLRLNCLSRYGSSALYP